MTSETTITLYGNVGAYRETRILLGRRFTKEVYDPGWIGPRRREFSAGC